MLSNVGILGYALQYFPAQPQQIMLSYHHNFFLQHSVSQQSDLYIVSIQILMTATIPEVVMNHETDLNIMGQHTHLESAKK